MIEIELTDSETGQVLHAVEAEEIGRRLAVHQSADGTDYAVSDIKTGTTVAYELSEETAIRNAERKLTAMAAFHGKSIEAFLDDRRATIAAAIQSMQPQEMAA